MLNNNHKQIKFALFLGNRIEPKPNLVAECPSCGNSVRAYCGDLVVHHWKHVKLSECDSWYENETEWHRVWKNHFSNEYQEVIKYDSLTNERHVADVYNHVKEVVIEFQHSSIDVREIEARENFYGRMIWVIDLISSNKNLKFINKHNEVEAVLNKMRHNLPKDFEVGSDYEMYESQKKFGNFLDMLNLDKLNTNEIHYTIEIGKKYMELCKKKDFSLMTWKNLHKRWDLSVKPKFIDIGTDDIYQLIERVKIGNAYVVKRYSKSEFISHYQ